MTVDDLTEKTSEASSLSSHEVAGETSSNQPVRPKRTRLKAKKVYTSKA